MLREEETNIGNTSRGREAVYLENEAIHRKKETESEKALAVCKRERERESNISRET